MHKNSRAGFTILELAIFLVWILAMVVLPLAVCKGNHWYTEEGILKQIRQENSAVESLISTERNIYNYSEITVKHKDGHTSKIDLDTDCLFNYKFVWK